MLQICAGLIRMHIYPNCGTSSKRIQKIFMKKFKKRLDKLPIIWYYILVLQKFLPVWWNWQTRRTQNPVVAIPCRFDPDHRHQKKPVNLTIDGFFHFFFTSQNTQFYEYIYHLFYNVHPFFLRVVLCCRCA